MIARSHTAPRRTAAVTAGGLVWLGGALLGLSFLGITGGGFLQEDPTCYPIMSGNEYSGLNDCHAPVGMFSLVLEVSLWTFFGTLGYLCFALAIQHYVRTHKISESLGYIAFPAAGVLLLGLAVVFVSGLEAVFATDNTEAMSNALFGLWTILASGATLGACWVINRFSKR